MKQLVLNWTGPFGIRDLIPKELRGCPGLYLVEHDSEIMYVGKAETEGAFHRAKDHFRGHGDSIGRWILEGRDGSKIRIWVAWIAAEGCSELINDAEKLLIFRLDTRANVNHSEKYEGNPLHIINKGNHPTKLPVEIKYP
jgi:hypothetical protein